jgi:hypothetical protein
MKKTKAVVRTAGESFQSIQERAAVGMVQVNESKTMRIGRARHEAMIEM